MASDLARYKDLCVDVCDGDRMSEFWSAALGLARRRLDDGDEQLTGPTPQHGVWVNVVAEPRTVKNRVHLDLHARSVEEYERLGASVLPGWGPFLWTVMADPEGGELCVFVRDGHWWSGHAEPSYRLYELAVDAADPHAIAQWWGDVLGVAAGDGDGFSYLENLHGAPFSAMTFSPVEEPKTVKNRIHWDISVGPDGVDALEARGATVLRARDDEISWTVMADPEGNEFCAFAPAD